MGIVALFTELVDWVKVIPKLVKLNSDQREETRKVVGELADELDRGLQVVELRIEGAQRIARSRNAPAGELDTYLSDSQNKLFGEFREFKICRGIREKRDHFAQLFHPAKGAVKLQNMRKVEDLLARLESDERMIMDDVAPMLADLQSVAATAPDDFAKEADRCLKDIKKRRRGIKDLAREVHDKL